MSDTEVAAEKNKPTSKAGGAKKAAAPKRVAKLAPVIAIDGPSGSGKGTIASAVAAELGFFYLDSGALYRAVALASLDREVAADDADALVHVVKTSAIVFQTSPDGQSEVLLGGQPVTDELRKEAVGERASQIATVAPLRQALLDRQIRWRRMPGLVADGRDMGTVVFPEADLKIYLTASAQIRAERRYKQLIGKGIKANMAGLLADIIARDDRDTNRAVAPLVAAPDAISIDSSAQSIDEVVTKVLDFARNRL